jgi:hypothetical protein
MGIGTRLRLARETKNAMRSPLGEGGLTGSIEIAHLIGLSFPDLIVESSLFNKFWIIRSSRIMTKSRPLPPETEPRRIFTGVNNYGFFKTI